MNLQDLLKDEYERIKKHNSRFSKRAFANRLGIHSSTLTRILNGTRRITPDLADRLLKRLDIDLSQKNSLLLAMHKTPEDLKNVGDSYKVLESEKINALDGWHYFAILSSFEVKDFQPSDRWMARYLGIDMVKTKQALLSLEAAGLIEKSKGAWKLIGTPTSSGKTSSKALAKIHREYILKSLEGLRSTDERQDISGITMAVSKRKLPEARRRILEFRRSLAQFLCGSESNDLDEVYRLNIQLFPLSRVGKSKV